MTPVELHQACHEACCQCPQFTPYDDDTHFQHWGEFGDIPRKGHSQVIKFWKENDVLWKSGYEEALPENVRQLFNEIDAVVAKAIQNYFQLRSFR